MRASAGRGGARARRGPEHGASTSARSKPSSSGGRSVASASTTVTFVAPSRSTFPRSSRARPGCSSTAVTSPASIVALPPGAAQSRAPARPPRADDERRQLRRAALRPDPPLLDRLLVHALDAVRARDVGRLARRVAAHEPHDRLGRLVLRAHQRERLLLAEVAPPDVVDPVGVGVLERPLGERAEQAAQLLGEPAHDRVRERHRALEPRAAGRARPSRSTTACARQLRVAELVRAEPERGEHGRIELANGPPPDRLDRVVERALALHRPVGEPLRERPVALVEPSTAVRSARSAYASSSKTRRTTSYAARRAGAITAGPGGTPRTSCACRPAGCTSSGTSSPSSTRAFQIVSGRPWSSARAPMCGDSARTRRSAPRDRVKSS